ncbi:MAG: hypothetical protein GF353_07840 [Candidatus Lokiarchaeota archaeon]|nr:hypothetical protein [Candidatus Lokiarchaeota archaeon]
MRNAPCSIGRKVESEPVRIAGVSWRHLDRRLRAAYPGWSARLPENCVIRDIFQDCYNGFPARINLL